MRIYSATVEAESVRKIKVSGRFLKKKIDSRT